jgi:hypothetical protein
MNKMIKRQDIVPPWIEKQQELVKAANTFRTRLRRDWRRHAARMIAGQGGTLQDKIKRAQAYARAEEVHNPRKRPSDQISVPTNITDDPVMVKIRRQAWAAEPNGNSSGTVSSTAESVPEYAAPFRDPAWEALERSYMELAIKNLNVIARSYNLMAPDLAKKPYFSLERELQSCFADVAPQIADTIRERAINMTKTSSIGGGPIPVAGFIDKLAGDGKPSRVYDSKTPNYGLKEMWRDYWSRPS